MAESVHQPLSLAPPTPADTASTQALIEELNLRGSFESDEGVTWRENVLKELQELVEDWSLSCAEKKQISDPTLTRSSCCRLLPFGSYSLGVHEPAADLDILMVCPRHVARADVFSDLIEKLKECQHVSQLQDVPSARVPVIKMKFRGVDVDLTCAVLPLPSVPPAFDIDDDALIDMCDETTAAALNGRRVSNKLLLLLPNVDSFRLLLRAVKLWARVKGIYGNAVGFIGGVGWSILCALVCILYPKAAPSRLLQKFFIVYSNWQWGQCPVMLCPIAEGNGRLSVWNPNANPRDRTHCMPIITPTYPAQNVTFNVSYSTLSVVSSELVNGLKVADRIVDGGEGWGTLFLPSNFFRCYPNYLHIHLASHSASDFRQWKGFIESQLRKLTMLLESSPPARVSIAHPWPQVFFDPTEKHQTSQSSQTSTQNINDHDLYNNNNTNNNNNNNNNNSNGEANGDGSNGASGVKSIKDDAGDTGPTSCSYFMGLRFSLPPGVGGSVDLSYAVTTFCTIAAQCRRASDTIQISHVKRRDLPPWAGAKSFSSNPTLPPRLDSPAAGFRSFSSQPQKSGGASSNNNSPSPLSSFPPSPSLVTVSLHQTLPSPSLSPSAEKERKEEDVNNGKKSENGEKEKTKEETNENNNNNNSGINNNENNNNNKEKLKSLIRPIGNNSNSPPPPLSSPFSRKRIQREVGEGEEGGEETIDAMKERRDTCLVRQHASQPSPPPPSKEKSMSDEGSDGELGGEGEGEGEELVDPVQ